MLFHLIDLWLTANEANLNDYLALTSAGASPEEALSAVREKNREKDFIRNRFINMRK